MRTLLTICALFALSAPPVFSQNTGADHAGHGAQMTMGDHAKMMKQHQSHMLQMLGRSDAEYDLRFINMMIQHHEGALAMAENALKNATHAEIKEMSQKIIESQKKEIQQLKSWRKAWYGQ